MIEVLATVLVIGMIIILPRHKKLLWLTVPVYLAGVIYITLLSRTADDGLGINLVPFHFVYWMRRYYHAYGIRGILYPLSGLYDNILLFIPCGFIIKCLRENIVGWKIVCIGFCISLLIEMIQMVFHLGMFETDDLMTNSLGTWIGVAIYQRTKRSY